MILLQNLFSNKLILVLSGQVLGTLVFAQKHGQHWCARAQALSEHIYPAIPNASSICTSNPGIGENDDLHSLEAVDTNCNAAARFEQRICIATDFPS